MAAQLFDQPTIVRLQIVIETIRSGKLLLPDFQRPFVWKDEQRTRLFDSIVKGLPIGSLMIWRTTQVLRVKETLEGFSLPTPAKEVTRSYLLDGQQRMFTLYAALTAEPANDAKARRRWPIYLDLEVDMKVGEKKEGESRFKLARRDGKVPITWFPLSAALSNRRVVEFQKALWASGTEEHNRLAERAEEVANIIRDYPLALVPLVVDDLGLVTQSFQRVNSAGSPMGEAHMLRALTYDGKFDLTDRFDKIVTGSAWGVLDHQILVNVIKAIAGVSVYGTEMSTVTDLLSSDGGPELLERVERSTIKAISFLHDRLKIRGEEALPYAFQLVALASAASEGRDLDAAADRLARWFWITTFTEHFTGMTAGQLRNAFEQVGEICEGVDPALFLPSTVSPITKFRATSVRSLGLMHMLATQDLVDVHGRDVDGPALLSRGSAVFVQLHPEYGADDPANRILVAPEQANETRRALLDFSEPAYNRLRESHLLQQDDAEAGQGDVLEARWERLQDLERSMLEHLGLTVRDE